MSETAVTSGATEEMGCNLSRYPGLAPPTPRGRRNRSHLNEVKSYNKALGALGTAGKAGRPTGQEGHFGGQSAGKTMYPGKLLSEPHAYLAESNTSTSQPVAPNSKEELNFGWFSVPRGQETSDEKGMGEPRDAPSRTGSTQPRDVPSRSGSTQPREVPSRTGSVAPRDVPSRTGSTQPRDVPSRTGSVAAMGVPSRTGSSTVVDGQRPPPGSYPHCHGNGPTVTASGCRQTSDDVIIDWPLFPHAQTYFPNKEDCAAGQRRPATAGQRIPSRLAAPPTPLPPLRWDSYGESSYRPTFYETSQQARRNRSLQQKGEGVVCFFTGDDFKARSQGHPCEPQGHVSNTSNNNTYMLIDSDPEEEYEQCKVIKTDPVAEEIKLRVKKNKNNSKSIPLVTKEVKRKSKKKKNKTDPKFEESEEINSETNRNSKTDFHVTETTHTCKKSKSKSNYCILDKEDVKINKEDSSTRSIVNLGFNQTSVAGKDKDTNNRRDVPVRSHSAVLSHMGSGMRKALHAMSRLPQMVLDFRSQKMAFRFRKLKNDTPFMFDE